MPTLSGVSARRGYLFIGFSNYYLKVFLIVATSLLVALSRVA